MNSNSAGEIIADVVLRLKNIEQQTKKITDDLSKSLARKPIEIDNIKLSDKAVRSLTRQIEQALSGRSGGGSPLAMAVGGAIGGAIAQQRQQQMGNRAAMPVTAGGGAFAGAAAGGWVAQGVPCPRCGTVKPASATFCPRCGKDGRSNMQRMRQEHPFAAGLIDASIGATGLAASAVVPFGQATLWTSGLAARAGLGMGRGIVRGVGAFNRWMDGPTHTTPPATLDDVVHWQQAGARSINDNLGNIASLLSNFGSGNGGRRRRRRRPGGGGGGAFAGMGAFASGDWQFASLAGGGGDWRGLSGTSFGDLPEENVHSFGFVREGSPAFIGDEEMELQRRQARAYKASYRGSRLLSGTRIGRRSGGTTLFSDMFDAASRGVDGLNYQMARGYYGARGYLERNYSPMHGRGQRNLALLGGAVAGAHVATQGMSAYNQYNIGAGAAAAGGDPFGLANAQAKWSDDVAGMVPVLGGLVSSGIEFFGGHKAAIAAAQAGTAFQQRTRYFRQDNRNAVLGMQAQAAAMTGGVSGQLRAVDLHGEVADANIRRNVNTQQEAYADKVLALSAKGDTAGAGQYREKIALLGRDADVQFKARKALTRAERAALRRGDRADANRSMSAVAVSNLTGVDDYSAERTATSAGYRNQIDRLAEDDPARSRLEFERGAALAAQDRQHKFATSQMGLANGGGAMRNVAAALGLSGNSIGSALAGFRADRMDAGVQLRGELRGIDPTTDPGRFAAVMGGHINRLRGIDLAQAGAQKQYQGELVGLGYDAQSGQRQLVGDFLGARTSQIDKAREQARATMPSGQFARYGRVLDLEQRAAGQQEENRHIGVRTSTARINAGAVSTSLAAEGKDFQAEIYGLRENTKADMEQVYASDLQEGEKNSRIRAIKRDAESRLKMVNRRMRESMTGGTATSLGNYVNFAGASSSKVVPDEDMGQARRAADDAAKGFDADANAVRDNVRQRQRGNEDFVAGQGRQAKGDAALDANDKSQAGKWLADIAGSMKTLIGLWQSGIGAQ